MEGRGRESGWAMMLFSFDDVVVTFFYMRSPHSPPVTPPTSPTHEHLLKTAPLRAPPPPAITPWLRSAVLGLPPGGR